MAAAVSTDSRWEKAKPVPAASQLQPRSAGAENVRRPQMRAGGGGARGAAESESASSSFAPSSLAKSSLLPLLRVLHFLLPLLVLPSRRAASPFLFVVFVATVTSSLPLSFSCSALHPPCLPLPVPLFPSVPAPLPPPPLAAPGFPVLKEKTSCRRKVRVDTDTDIETRSHFPPASVRLRRRPADSPLPPAPPAC